MGKGCEFSRIKSEQFTNVLFSETNCCIAQTDRENDRQTDRQRERQTGRQTDRQTDREND